MKDIFTIRVELLKLTYRVGLELSEIEARARQLEGYIFSRDPRSDQVSKLPRRKVPGKPDSGSGDIGKD